MENEFALRLQNLCDKHDYDYKEVSKMLGYSDNTFGNYARGERTPDLHTAIKIADLFQVSLDYLLRGTEPNYNSMKMLQPIFESAGIENPSILKIENWHDLPSENIKEISNHFDWIMERHHKDKK